MSRLRARHSACSGSGRCCRRLRSTASTSSRT
jgi:hypothetical protein